MKCLTHLTFNLEPVDGWGQASISQNSQKHSRSQKKFYVLNELTTRPLIFTTVFLKVKCWKLYNIKEQMQKYGFENDYVSLQTPLKLWEMDSCCPFVWACCVFR